jgi:hypothetical protein
MLILIWDTDATFKVLKDLGGLYCLKITITGKDLVLKVQETHTSLELTCTKLKSVATDGGKNICGSKTGVVGQIYKEVI